MRFRRNRFSAYIPFSKCDIGFVSASEDDLSGSKNVKIRAELPKRFRGTLVYFKMAMLTRTHNVLKLLHIPLGKKSIEPMSSF